MREHEETREIVGREEGRGIRAGIDRVGDTYIFANTFSPVLQGWKVKRANDVRSIPRPNPLNRSQFNDFVLLLPRFFFLVRSTITEEGKIRR